MLSNIFKFVNLADLAAWIKKYQADIMLVIGVVLVSLLAFAAGYIAAKEDQKPSILFEEIQ